MGIASATLVMYSVGAVVDAVRMCTCFAIAANKMTVLAPSVVFEPTATDIAVVGALPSRADWISIQPPPPNVMSQYASNEATPPAPSGSTL